MSLKDVPAGNCSGEPRSKGGHAGAELPLRLDAQQFARAQDKLSGVGRFESFERLAQDGISGQDGIDWSLAGSVDDDGACWLTLEVAASLNMPCQRCLQDVGVDVRSTSRFRLVFAGESWNDEDLDDDSFEALEVEGPLDVRTLVEDEVLLALPVIALHDGCAMPEPTGDDADGTNAGRPSPFAVLGKLKRS